MIIRKHISKVLEELSDLQRSLQKISDVMPDRHFIVDKTGGIIARFGNSKAEGFYQTDDPSGSHISDLCSPELAQILIKGVEEAVNQDKCITLEYSVSPDDIKPPQPIASTLEGEQWFEVKLVPLKESVSDRPLVVCSARNITERKLLELELKMMAVTDPMTKLFNRRHMMEQLEKSFDIFTRYATPGTILSLDIDFFKHINDTYGHDIGDAVLIQFSSFLQSELREVDVISRFGGEEFIILMPNITAEDSTPAVERLIKNTRLLHVIKGDITVDFTISGGLTEIKKDDKNIEETLKRADTALYQSKESGRDKFTMTI